MFTEITEEMYKARATVIADIAHYAALYAADSLEYMCQAEDIKGIYYEGGRGEITREMIEEEIIEGAKDEASLYYTDTHTLVLAWQSYRYDGADTDYGGTSIETLLARVLIDKVLENNNGELERVVVKALEA